MKKLNLKIIISIFYVLSILLLTGCGDGGSGSSGKNSEKSLDNNSVQAACIANIITNLRNNSKNIFPTKSFRLNLNNPNRASLSEIATGEDLMKLCGITKITNDGGFVDTYNDSIEKFIDRNSKNIIYQSDSMVIATNGNYHIGLTVTNLDKVIIKTYFATEENSLEIVGISYIKINEYTTFAFMTNNDFNNLEGRLFKYDQNSYTYNQNEIKNISLAEIYGDTTSFYYNELINNTSEIYNYNGNKVSGGKGNNSVKASYIEKYPETINIRLAIKPLLDKADKIIKYGSSSSERANIEITDSLKQINTLGKVLKIIPVDTIDKFASYFKNSELLIDKEKFYDSLIPGGIRSMIISNHAESGLNVGLLIEVVNIKYNTLNFIATTRVWFIADPNGKSIVCFAYCDTQNSKTSNTFIFKINAENKNVEGLSFWNEEIQPKGFFENVGIDENDYPLIYRNSSFISNNPEYFTYTLFNSISRNKIQGSVTIKYDGTLISNN